MFFGWVEIASPPENFPECTFCKQDVDEIANLIGSAQIQNEEVFTR
jgi:hypothetical protein